MSRRSFKVLSICAVLITALAMVASASAQKLKYSYPCGHIPANGSCNAIVKFEKSKIVINSDGTYTTSVTIHLTPVNGANLKYDIVDIEFGYGPYGTDKKAFVLGHNISSRGQNFTESDKGATFEPSSLGFGVFGPFVFKDNIAVYGDQQSNWGTELFATGQ